jgi:hypothetical protein
LLAKMPRLGAVLGLVLLSAALVAGSDVLVITADNFDQAVQDHSFLVVEFFAPWSLLLNTRARERAGLHGGVSLPRCRGVPLPDSLWCVVCARRCGHCKHLAPEWEKVRQPLA